MEFRKYAVVPYDSVNKHMTSAQQISDFDQEMAKILNNNRLNDDEKVKQYYQVLQHKFKMSEFNSGVNTHTSESSAPAEPENKYDYSDIILEAAPAQKKRQAQILLNFLKNHSDVIHWNARGEVSIHNQLIPGSNIGDLSNMLLSNTTRSMVGKDPFLQVLTELNMPRHYIKNSNLGKEPQAVFLPVKTEPTTRVGSTKITHKFSPEASKKKKVSKRKRQDDPDYKGRQNWASLD